MCSNENTNGALSKSTQRLKYQQIHSNSINGSTNNSQSSALVATGEARASFSPPSSSPSHRSSADMTLDGTFVQQQSSSVTTPSSSTSGGPSLTSTSSTMSTMLTVPSPNLLSLDHYRFQLYNYAMAERLRCAHYSQTLPVGNEYTSAAAAAAMGAMGPYGPRLALSMSLFHNRVFQPEEPKPQHSYIGLIAIAILSSPESKLVLSDIYQHILDNYPYFRSRGPGWRNSIRHNLSLNDCFVKAGRSANGKGHYWAIHPANQDDFKRGDFRRRKAQRKVRKHMGLAVDDDGTDSPSPPPLSITPPPMSSALHNLAWGITADAMAANQSMVAPSITASSCRIAATNNTITGEVLNVVTSQYHQHHRRYAPYPVTDVIYRKNESGEHGESVAKNDGNDWNTREKSHIHRRSVAATNVSSAICRVATKPITDGMTIHSVRKRQFDVASLLAPDHTLNDASHDTVPPTPTNATTDIDEDIDVDDSGDHETDQRLDKFVLHTEEVNPRGQKIHPREPNTTTTDHSGMSKAHPFKYHQISSNCDLTESEDDLLPVHHVFTGTNTNRTSANKIEQMSTLTVASSHQHHQQTSSLNHLADNKYGSVFPYFPVGATSGWPGVDPRILVERYYGQYMVAAAVAQQSQKHNNNNNNNNHNFNGHNHHGNGNNNDQISTPSTSPLHTMNSPRSSTPNHSSSSPTNLSAI